MYSDLNDTDTFEALTSSEVSSIVVIIEQDGRPLIKAYRHVCVGT